MAICDFFISHNFCIFHSLTLTKKIRFVKLKSKVYRHVAKYKEKKPKMGYNRIALLAWLMGRKNERSGD